MTTLKYRPRNSINIPHNLDGETALDLVDFFYQLADEILRFNDGNIRDYYDHAHQMRLQTQRSPQLNFPWTDPFHDLPF